jgi:hypothetical protein
MEGNLKNTITTVLAILIVVATAANVYMTSVNGEEWDWYKFVIGIVAALVAYFTGKDKDKPFAKPVKDG